MKSFRFYSFLLSLSLLSCLHAQSQTMEFLTYPKSVASEGMGFSGVALLSDEDALTDNPARLIFSKGFDISLFHRTSRTFASNYILNTVSTKFVLNNIANFCVNYADFDQGTWSVMDSYGREAGKVSSFQRSLSVAAATTITPGLSTGVQLTYVYDKISGSAVNRFLFSLGLDYKTQLFDRQINFGFSIMNLGGAVTYNNDNFRYAPPLNIHIGAAYEPVKNEFASILTQLAFSKPIDSYLEVPSTSDRGFSLGNLFTDWNDFPNDGTIHSGIALKWNNLDIGKGFSYFEEFYFGNCSGGTKSQFTNEWTTGCKVGVENFGIRFSLGFSSRWFNSRYLSDVFFFPYGDENFQFSVQLNNDLLLHNGTEKPKYPELKHITLSVGFADGIKLGRYHEYIYSREIKTGFRDAVDYSVEGAFYMNTRTALVSSFNYQSMNFSLVSEYTIPYPFSYLAKSTFGLRYETISFSTSVRYHPVVDISGLFVQAGVGIARINPIEKSVTLTSEPHMDYSNVSYSGRRYHYAVLFPVSVGYTLFASDLVITPNIGFRFMLDRQDDRSVYLVGYNELDLGLKVGLRF